MTYDIFFVRREPGQSFEEALEAGDDDDVAEPGPFTATEREQWERILVRARQILGEVDVIADDFTRELSNPATGIELAFSSGEAQLRLPHSHAGGSDMDVMSKLHALARMVETVTDLEGYDPQLQEPLSDLRRTGPIPVVPPAPSERDEDDGPDRSAATTTAREPMPPAATGDSGRIARRWWEFWRR